MIFVTGATGLLGTHLLQALLQQQQPVKALYRSQIPAFKNSSDIEWVQGDILDVPKLEDAIQNVEQVYHCAAKVSFQPKDKEDLYKTNVEGTANVVNACLQAGVKKLLHVSSVAALGSASGSTAIDETSLWSEATNRSIYGKTKHLAEMEVWRGVGEGLLSVIVNPSLILGSHDWNDGSAQIFKTVYNQFPWYTDGITGFVDVKDVAKTMVLLMNSNITAERFVVNAENLPYKQVFDAIADGFQKKKPYRKVAPFLAELIWRAEGVRSLFTGSQPLLTRESASSAQAKRFYNNTKLLTALPQFRYTPFNETVARICREFQQKYGFA